MGDESRLPQAHQHFELLLRLVDARGERFLPTVFLPAVERHNLITRIDRWVIERALEWLAERPAEAPPFLYSINISGTSIREDGFADFVLERFEATGVSGDCVCFEITETAAMGNLSMAPRLIQTIRKPGCRFALDDFGTGPLSFAYLRTLKLDYLKIASTFVKDIVEDPVDFAMVRSINDVAQLLGLKTVAESVESEVILQNHDVTAFDSQAFAQCGGQGNLAAARYNQCFAHLFCFVN